MITVRSISERPVRGSSSCGNSSSTPAISLPRSPQPRYTITSALQPLARLSSRIVLPVPNPPGMAALPPSATGNSESRMRWPVTSGSSDVRRARTGRGVRTGQKWLSATSCVAPSSDAMRSTVASSVTSPASAIQATRPATFGGSKRALRAPARRQHCAEGRAGGRAAAPACTAGSKRKRIASGRLQRAQQAVVDVAEQARTHPDAEQVARCRAPPRRAAGRSCPRTPARRSRPRSVESLPPAGRPVRRGSPRAAGRVLRRARAAPGR